MDGGGSPRRALPGDLVAGAAQRNGRAGLIINGAVRDGVAPGRPDLGVEALGTVDLPVPLGEVTFRPGDTVHADGGGTVVAPAARPRHGGEIRPGVGRGPWCRVRGAGFTAGP
ncbi:S-adenosylmethionine: 2-demethylmenaquinone methyltransferase [Streptomyces sp. NPDC051704]|uniref:RraA family protein n=1 Tax=Streptomyces sp. NPDC051704 TaxID=3365671 RepID=UPI00379FE603